MLSMEGGKHRNQWRIQEFTEMGEGDFLPENIHTTAGTANLFYAIGGLRAHPTVKFEI